MTGNRKGLWAAILLTAGLLCACRPAGETPSPTAGPTPTPTSSPSPTPSPIIPSKQPTISPTEAPAVPLDFSLEPPLDDFSASIAVPDFLTPEQQDLYRRAHCLYLYLFGVTSANVDRLGDPDAGYSNETVVIDHKTYTVSQGRYRRWEDFDALVHAVFTDDFWDQHNNSVSAVGQPWTLFREYNGSLCYLDTEKGQGYYYNENFPDEFRLVSQNEERVLFTLIGHYSWVWPREGETFEERDARRAREYEYTFAFPIWMENTASGWRFHQFHSALVDEAAWPMGRITEEETVSYVDEFLGFAMEFPQSWRGKVEAQPEYYLNHRGGNRISFYHKPTRDACDGGVLFYIDCYPGLWTQEDPPVMAGSSTLVLQTDQYTFFFRTPSDVQWHEWDRELELAYKTFMADFEYVRTHITPLQG